MIASPIQPLQMFFGIVLGILVSLSGVLIWNTIRSRLINNGRAEDSIGEMHNDIQIGLLVLAAFALGAFLTYVLLSLRL